MGKTTDKLSKLSRGSDSPTQQFLGATLDMSWRLAIVVLVPIIGGFELDKMLDTLPIVTVLGFIVAMAGMGYVMWRQFQLFQPFPAKKSKKRVKS